jgi:hypothetical protein
VSKSWLRWAVVWAVVTAAVFLLMNWILALFIAIVGLTLVVIAAVSSDWEQHPTFEQRELARAQKRKARFERNADARARDRALWEAHQAKQARKAAGS